MIVQYKDKTAPLKKSNGCLVIREDIGVDTIQGRFTDHYSQDFYDTEWNMQPFNQVGETSSEFPAPKPPFLNEMLDLSERLSTGIPHVRVDWYYANGQLYFGEMTFFDASGYLDFVPDEYNEILGSWIQLPEKK